MADPFDYLEARDDGDELITDFGMPVVIRKLAKSGTDYSPTLSPTDYATKGVKIEFTRRHLATGEVLATDERWLVAAGPLTALGITELNPGDIVVIGLSERKVGPLSRPLAPAGTVVLFDVQAQK